MVRLLVLCGPPKDPAAVADVPNYATGGAAFLYTEIEELI